MIPEEETARRGEPVIVYGRAGTIEWGGVTMPASVYFEEGGRIAGVALRDIIPSPGGPRPVWDRLRRTLDLRP